MIILSWCDDCANITGKNGCHFTCKAFPDGIPFTFENGRDKELKICNNGIGYVHDKNSAYSLGGDKK